MKNIKYFKIKIIKFNLIHVHSLDCQMIDKQLYKFTLCLSKILETCEQLIWKKKKGLNYKTNWESYRSHSASMVMCMWKILNFENEILIRSGLINKSQ